MDPNIIMGIFWGIVVFIAYHLGKRNGKPKYALDWTCPKSGCDFRIRSNHEDTYNVCISTHTLNHSLDRH